MKPKNNDSFPSLSYGFDSRYPLHQTTGKHPSLTNTYAVAFAARREGLGFPVGKNQEQTDTCGNANPAEVPQR